jgi:translocation and assembly module TamB
MLLLAAVTGLAALAWAAPLVLVQTSLRDWPLANAFAGIDGTITSGGATWNWLGRLEYRDVVLRDRAGRAAVVVPLVVIDRGLVRLAIEPDNLGTVRLVEPEALVEVRGDGSSLEDILAAWLAAAGRPPAMELEVVNATVEFVDVVRQDAWRLSEVIAAGTLLPDGGLSGWTAAGRLRHSAGPAGSAASLTPTAGTPPLAAAGERARLDRSTIPAAAAAVLVRDGGWSLSSPAAGADGSRTITVAAHRLPLGASSVVATRFGLSHLVDGIADIRLDVTDAPAGRRAQGDLALDDAVLCDAVDLDERFMIERCTMPFDVVVEPGRIVVHRFAATSPMFRAEASGGLRLPRDDVARWAEEIVGEDFTLAVDVDLAAASRALPHGLAVRPDVRVTGGALRFAATSRGDGDDRLIELRATARDLAAVQGIATASDAAPREKPLAWPEPFTAWLKGRRGPGRDERLRIEEARLVSEAVELSAAGTPAAVGIQWTADLGGLVGQLAEVLDLAAVTAKGRTRGRIDLSGGDSGSGGRSMKATASVTELEVAIPGRPTWRDAEVAFEAEGTGSVAGGVAAIEAARGIVACGADRLEASLDGGVFVDLMALVGLSKSTATPWIRPAANADAVAAECSIAGDLARWQPRLALVAPAIVADGLELGGGITAAVAVSPAGDVWRIERAGGEIEKFTARWQGREIAEPRLVATVAGRVHATTGQIDIASAELLSASMSVRTGGLSWMPAPSTPSAAPVPLVDRLRGRMQWQADVGRIERWLVPADVAANWPASGRAWGTLEVVDTQAGVNTLIEATGSQITLSTAPAGRPLWSEPRMTAALEVTRPHVAGGGIADQLRIDRLAVESSTLAVAATGVVEEWSSRRTVALDGTAAYDWAQVSRLLTPWTGGRVKLVGAGGRAFALRGPLATAAPTGPTSSGTAALTEAAATLPLPDDWLSATRGRDPGEGGLTARLARPVAATANSTAIDERIRSLSVDTSAAWTAGDVEGFSLSAGEMAVRLLEGQLAFGPFDLPAAGGRLRGAPWIRLAPWPGELIVPPGRVAERVALTGPMCDRWVKWLSPVLGQSTHMSGVATVDLAGARVPLGDPFGGELAGQIVFENLEVTPNAALQPLVNLIVKLQSVIDPRFAFGDKAVLMRIRPDPVRVRLAGRRLAHDGLVMDAGQLVVKSQGSVGEDGTLEMVVEVALRGDLVGSTPVVGKLLRTPLVIPLKGTVHRPQFDARAIELSMGRIVENTAQAVINDGIGRGLEAIFGEPRPPASAPQLVTPPQPTLMLPPQR